MNSSYKRILPQKNKRIQTRKLTMIIAIPLLSPSLPSSSRRRSSHPAPSTTRRADAGRRRLSSHIFAYFSCSSSCRIINLYLKYPRTDPKTISLPIYMFFAPTRLAHRSNLGRRARRISLGRARSKSGYLAPTEGFLPRP